MQEPSSGAQENDNEGRMPGQLPTASEQSSVRDYHSIKKAAKEKVAALAGHEVTVGTRKNGSMKWKVIAMHDPMDENIVREYDPHKTLDDCDFNIEYADPTNGEIAWKIKADEVNWTDLHNKHDDWR